MAPCEFVLTAAKCVSKRSRCGAVRICHERGEPSAGDCACRRALAVAPCEVVLAAANPLRRSCVSKRSRCRAARICLELGEPSAQIVRVETLSLCGSCVSKRSRCGAVRIFWRSLLANGNCLIVRTPSFAIAASRVRFFSGPRQLQLKNGNSQVPK